MKKHFDRNRIRHQFFWLWFHSSDVWRDYIFFLKWTAQRKIVKSLETKSRVKQVEIFIRYIFSSIFFATLVVRTLRSDIFLVPSLNSFHFKYRSRDFQRIWKFFFPTSNTHSIASVCSSSSHSIQEIKWEICNIQSIASIPPGNLLYFNLYFPYPHTKSSRIFPKYFNRS